jgi:hypothetical protein
MRAAGDPRRAGIASARADSHLGENSQQHEVIRAAQEVNPGIRVARAMYLRSWTSNMRAPTVFTGEGEWRSRSSRTCCRAWARQPNKSSAGAPFANFSAASNRKWLEFSDLQSCRFPAGPFDM